jgi:hypothetical protein
MKLLFTTVISMLTGLSVTAGRWETAKVEFSDGRKCEGKLSVMGSRPLTITPTGAKYQQKILLRDIISLRQVVREQSMNRPWIYKEAGKVEKMYLEGKYPFINFTTEILLTNGKIIRGDIVSVAFKFKGNGPRKIFMTRQLKGKVGEKMEAMVYPARISFNNRRTTVKPIIIKLQNGGKIQHAAALDNEREVVRFGKINGSEIVFGDLFPATYDIYILTDNKVLAGLSNTVPAKAQGAPLPANALAELRKVFPLADDFFKERRLLAISGNIKFCKSLVYKRREKYYHSHKHTPGGWMWHLDIWSWHLAGKEWKIDRRYIMVRHKQKDGEKVRGLYLVEKFGAVKPGASLNIDLNFNFEQGQKDGIRFIRKLK